jgi:hypothetical protein
MSITKVKNYNISPYYDDFDETKNFHRILFRPGKSVQVRELTQLQTALQAQIDSFGQYNFNDGSRVVSGKVSVNTSYDYIKVESSANSYLSEFVGTTITGATNGVEALVLKVIQAENSDADTLYVQYTSSGTSNTTSTFATGETVTSNDPNIPRTAVVGGGGGSTIADPIGQGSLVSIEEGIYFISGTFVYVAAQNLILDKYTNAASYIVGLEVSETLVSSSEDSTLLDNAAGVPNSAAPGANRYKIETTLIKQSLDLSARTINDYIVLLRVDNGIIQNQVTEKVDTELTDRLARRTFEESGDYVVRPYILDMREHLDDGAGNGGYLTAVNGGSNLKIAIGVEPSVSYVKGFRVENLATRYVEVDKTRGADDQKTTEGVVTSTGFGSYVKLSSSTSGTPDINDYTTVNLEDVSNNVIGTCRARGYEIDGSEKRMYIFDVSMNAGKTFSQVHEFKQNSTGFNGTFAGSSALFETGENSLVYKLPAEAIQTLKSGANHTADYIARVRIQSTGNITANTATFNMPAGTTLANNDDVIMVDDNGATVPIEMADSNVSGVGTSTATVTGITSNGSGLAQGIFNVQVTNGSAKSKILQSAVADVITYVGGTSSYELSEVDIISITSIIDSQGTDVTDKFVLDNGQRSNFYTNGSVVLKGGQTLPTGTFTVTYDAFQHSAAGGDYFSVDSYPEFEDIPVFDGLELRDCIDFRPTKARSGSSAGSEFSSGTGTSAARAIQPVGAVSTDITFYLSRIDKLALTTSGDFKIIKGISSIDPIEPEDIEDSITLYTIRVNPYVFNETDILPKMIDNRRYTMRDIGKLEKRINTLEYYTSLSLLEKSASEAQIFDSGTGDMRFKNGFITDAFYGHNVGNSANEDYAVSIDKSNGILRPMFDERSVHLVRKVGDSGTCQKHAGGVVTLPITSTVSEVNQPYSTYAQLVNPYSVAVWEGTIKLSPESDEWKEVERRPDVIIDDNGLYDQFVSMQDEKGVFGTVWNEWENNWTGGHVTTTVKTTKVKNISNQEVKSARNAGIPVSSSGKIRVDKTTVRAGTLTGTATRTGIESYVTSDLETKVLDDKVLEINFIPFMRSRKIYFEAQLLKPNTKVYPYFSDTNISAYTRSETALVEFSDQTEVETYEGETAHPDGATDLVTDSAGAVRGSFIIPRNDLLQFKTGTREFKLIDNDTNDNDAATTRAFESFYAQGLLEIVEKTIVNTKVPRIATREVSESKAITESVYDVKVDIVKYYDPLAQTFVIDRPGGVYVTELDLFFAQIDDSIPVSVSIRTVENGIPTQKIIPGTEQVIYPSAITTSSDASVSKTIPFDFPVHLETGSEYAIVIVSNSDVYMVYVSETGGFDLTNADFRVIKQPYNGVFFTSANASTWSPEQSKDLKFNLKRAVFDTSPQTITLVNDTLPRKKLTSNPFSGTNVGSDVRLKVQHRNHGMYATADGIHQVTISGVSGTVNGIPSASINGTHNVLTPELDSYVIEIASQNVTTEDSQFGGAVVRATENQIMDTFKPHIQSIEFKEAFITYSIQSTQAASVDSTTQANYQVDTFNQLAVNRNTTFDRPYMVASQTNETLRLSGGKSLSITATMSNSGIDNITPVIDLNRASVIAVQNRINDNTDNKYTVNGTLVADTETTGTTSAAKYVTKRVDLSTEADQLDIYMSVNKPSTADIRVFYKATTEDQVSFDDIAWTEVTPVTPLQTNDGGVYSDSHFTVDHGTNFKSFAVKVVLKSQNSSIVPTVRDFRAIATV